MILELITIGFQKRCDLFEEFHMRSLPEPSVPIDDIITTLPLQKTIRNSYCFALSVLIML